MRPLSLARLPGKNLAAHPLRTLLLVLLALAQAACLVSGAHLLWKARQELVTAEGRLGADILVYPSSAASKIPLKKALMQGTPVEAWKSLSSISKLPDCPNLGEYSRLIYLRDTTGEEPRWIVGYDPETDFALSPWAEEGSLTALPAGAVAAGSGVGDTVTLFCREWPVAARLAPTGSVLDEAVFVPISGLTDVIAAAHGAGVTAYDKLNLEDTFSVLLIRVRSREEIDVAYNWLATRLRKTKAVRSEAALTGNAAGIQRQAALTAALGGIAWCVLLAAQAVLYSLLLRERRRELYVWRAVGASRNVILGVLGWEALLTGLAGSLLGAVGAWVIAGVPAQGLVPGALAAAVTVFMGWLSARLAAGRTLRGLDSQMLTL